MIIIYLLRHFKIFPLIDTCIKENLFEILNNTEQNFIAIYVVGTQRCSIFLQIVFTHFKRHKLCVYPNKININNLILTPLAPVMVFRANSRLINSLDCNIWHYSILYCCFSQYSVLRMGSITIYKAQIYNPSPLTAKSWKTRFV